jgi:hypothetical protein
MAQTFEVFPAWPDDERRAPKPNRQLPEQSGVTVVPSQMVRHSRLTSCWSLQ